MAKREIQIPSGPDLTQGQGFEPFDAEEPTTEFPGTDDALAEGEEYARLSGVEGGKQGDALAEPIGLDAMLAAAVAPSDARAEGAAETGAGAEGAAEAEAGAQVEGAGAETTGEAVGEAASLEAGGFGSSDAGDGVAALATSGDSVLVDSDYHPVGLSDDDAASQAVDDFQMSVLALKDSIGQGRELKEREKEREQLSEALKADHLELSDRENILANYQQIAAEQDAIVTQATQQRDAAKAELSQATMDQEQVRAQLEALREKQAVELQPLETELGKARAAADQAKNDERSRKSELNAAESEARRSDDSDTSTMVVAQLVQVQGAYDEAKARSEQAKAQLGQVQAAYDEAKQRAEQAAGPLERSIEDLAARATELKTTIATLGEQISAARNRRQYCDTVFQYPEETAKMRSEVEEAEAMIDKMDASNDVLRQQLAESRQKARKAKLAIGFVVLIIVVFIVLFIVLSNR